MVLCAADIIASVNVVEKKRRCLDAGYWDVGLLGYGQLHRPLSPREQRPTGATASAWLATLHTQA